MLAIAGTMATIVATPAPSARQLHESLIVLDTHFDTPANFGRPKLVADKGGVIQINAFSNYMIAPPPPNTERETAMRALMAKRRAVEAKYPVPRATFDDFRKHLLYAIRLVGIDHVGVSGDFDGGGGVAGLDDVSAYPKITAALIEAGYGRDDIAKVWGGNALRVLREAQALAEPGAVPAVVSVTR